MSSQTVALIPHPATPSRAVREVTARASLSWDGMLTAVYTLQGDIAKILVPTPRPPRFVDDLWRHTCCEVFVGRKGQTSYDEFNFSPSGEWAMYRFARTRERAPLDAAIHLEDFNPDIVVQVSESTLKLTAAVAVGRLGLPQTPDVLALGFSVVIEDKTGVLSYWALKHPLAKPDFHHPASFALELHEIRD